MVHAAQLGALRAGHSASLLPIENMQHGSLLVPFQGPGAAGQAPLAPLSLHNGPGFSALQSCRQLSGRTNGFPFSTLPALRCSDTYGPCPAAAVPELPAAVTTAAISHGAGVRRSRAYRCSEDDNSSWHPAPEGAAESSVTTESDDLYMPGKGKHAAAASRKPRPPTGTSKGAAAGDVRARTGGSSKYRG
jgi:hypothetical protein